MKKKVIAGVMSIMMMAMAIPAFAEESQMEVTYTVQSKYEVTIPKLVELNVETERIETIQASVMNITQEEEVVVKVLTGIDDGAVTLERKNAHNDKTTSKVQLIENDVPRDIGADGVVAIFTNQNTDATTGGTLSFAKLAKDLKAGEWSGTITFDISIK